MLALQRLSLVAGALLCAASPSWAYIGPGAGMVFLSSFLALLLAFALGLALVVLGVFRLLFGLLRRRGGRPGAKADRVVILGFDGLDPRVAERLMADGQLSYLKALADSGTYTRLRTTCPPMSPVAWSTFATGTNPGKHNIHDFLRRNPATYGPELSSTRIRGDRRVIRFGRYGIPIKSPTVEPLQKSKPFWEVLGDNGIFSAVMRVPITYPPKRFRGVILAGMCAPDLLGTQGTFTYYTTSREEAGEFESGLSVVLEGGDGTFRTDIRGPANPVVETVGSMCIPMTVTVDGETGARLNIDGSKHHLSVGEYSDWLPLTFRAGLGYRIRGLCKFRLISTEPHVRLYQSPINVDPASPSMPLSHPTFFSTYLAKTHGPYATLGLAEDTWALNEGILSEEAFLEQCHEFHRERRRLFLDVLSKVRSGLFVCVFDLTDRVQHMFLGRSTGGDWDTAEIDACVVDAYRRLDRVVGEVRQKLDDGAVLIVMSDHGFAPFRRCFDLNRWLCDHGYLFLQEAHPQAGEVAGGIDWKRTRAYGVGLSGLYLNLKGRERQGVVEPGEEADSLKRELIEALSKVVDPETGDHPITEVFDSRQVYAGPYVGEAPDLIMGYRRGYRVSWDSVLGKVGEDVLFDNPKHWAADHCMHPEEVPGVLFCSHRLRGESPWIGDIAPTVLGLLGVEVPGYMDGRGLEMVEGSA